MCIIVQLQKKLRHLFKETIGFPVFWVPTMAMGFALIVGWLASLAVAANIWKCINKFRNNSKHQLHNGVNYHGPTSFLTLPDSGHRCHYIRVERNNDEEIVLLLHGVSVTSAIWYRHIEIFAKSNFSVVTFDFFGHGYSDCPDSLQYNHVTYAEQTKSVLDALNLCNARVNVVGYSFGGLVASAFAARYPSNVKRLILMDSVGFHATPLPTDLFRLDASFFPQAFIRGVYKSLRYHYLAEMAGFAGDTLLRSFAQGMDIDHDDVVRVINWQNLEAAGTQKAEKRSWIDGILQRVISSKSMVKELILLLVLWSWQTRVASRKKVFSGIIRDIDMLDDFAEEIEKASKATGSILLMWGERDWLVPAKLTRRFKARMNNSKCVKIPNCGHNAPMQRPRATADEIIRFIQETKQN